MIFRIAERGVKPGTELRKILTNEKVLACETCYLTGMKEGEIPEPCFAEKAFEKTYAERRGETVVRYYSVEMYPDASDTVEPFELALYGMDVAEELFHGCEAVIAVHGGTLTPHLHMIVCSVNCLSGKPLGYTADELRKMSTRAGMLAAEHGLSLTAKGRK